MKIVIIREEIIQPDITVEELISKWKELEAIPGTGRVQLQIVDTYPSMEELDELVEDADALFGVWITEGLMSEAFFKKHPKLKYIATLGHGYESFDYAMTRRYGVTVTNTVYGAQTIAEHAFALLMHTCHHIEVQDQRVRKIDWSDPGNAPEFCQAVVPLIELYGKTVGVVGLGAIGFAFAKMAAGFGMHVISYSRTVKRGEAYSFVEQVSSLGELLARADVISLHLPENGNTHVINEETIARMKDGVILINTARGILIDEAALAEALKSGKVRAAALDVLAEEPPRHGTPLLTAPNCTITGHIAWLTRESRFRAIDMAIDNFKNYLNGTPTSVINHEGA